MYCNVYLGVDIVFFGFGVLISAKTKCLRYLQTRFNIT